MSYTKNRPSKCPKCQSPKLNFEVLDRIDYLITEEQAICKCSGNIPVAYYAYGTWCLQDSESGTQIANE